MSNQPRILFVSHDASVTGAPNSLLNFLDWIVQHRKGDFRILLLDGGPLEAEFAQRGPTTVIRQPRASVRDLLPRAWSKVRRVLGQVGQPDRPWTPSRSEQNRVDACLATFNANLIYLNSVAAAPVLACIGALDVPVLTFLRELREYVDKTRATGWLERLIERTDAFISVSEAAKKQLIGQCKLPDQKFTVINTFIDTRQLRHASREESRAALLQRAGVASSEFIVAGCGTTDWRKGSDLFLSIARTYFENRPDDRVVFIWIGDIDDDERQQTSHDIQLSGLAGRVIFIGEQLDAATLLAGADVLALTSREEPFARVMLEAALGRCPTVCFDNSGGPTEFIRKGCGIAVPYLSINAFASAIQRLRQDETLRTTLGNAAFTTTVNEHDTQVGAKRVYAVVEALLSRPKSAQGTRSGRGSDRIAE